MIYIGGSSNTIENNIFTSNTASGDNVSGGVIYVDGDYITISSNTFEGNRAIASGNSSMGGAINIHQSSPYNTIANNIFINNSANFGGAIDTGTDSNTITNNIFLGNSAGSQGGAIYFFGSGNTIKADAGVTLFQGNYVGTAGTDMQAIYQQNSNYTLNLSVVNSGTMTFYDYITGWQGFDTTISGDNTSTLNLYNEIKDSDVSTSGAFTFNTANNSILTYNFLTFTPDADTQFTIDLDLSNQKSDVFKTTNWSSGTLTLVDINIIGSQNADNTVIQVISNTTANSTLQLALTQDLINRYNSESTTDYGSVQADNNWSDKFGTVTTNYSLGLTTTKTANDSISYSGSITGAEPIIEVARAATPTTRTFTTDNPTAVYTLGYIDPTVTGIGPVSGTLTVSGAIEGSQRSTLDLNNRGGFALSDPGSTLNLADMAISNGNKSGNGGAVNQTDGNLSVDNVLFNSNTTTGKYARGGAIYTDASNSIANSTFINNIANGTDAQGGALYITNSNILTNNSFLGNVAGKQGGAIYINGALYANGSSNTIAADNLSPQKAAILLRLALATGADAVQIREMYLEY